jgi:L-histidine N-alpha-methyltransferase
MNPLTDTLTTAVQNTTFYNDVISGLQSSPKHLQSKYFYDTAGDKLFQQMAALCEAMIADGSPFDLIELGAGDATKSTYLLRYLLEQRAQFTYLPIDISANTITYLQAALPAALPNLNITGLNGDYFDMLKKAAQISDRRKVVLFLGSNIGNMPVHEAEAFCRELRAHLSPKDRVLIGIDLKKNPEVILAAYNDRQGITRQFNLNLLTRINSELQADFDLSRFSHFPAYDPDTGACNSYLISLQEQDVHIGGHTIHFEKDEYIFMEVSQKYSMQQATDLGTQAGFKPLTRFTDNKNWFLDAIWVAV